MNHYQLKTSKLYFKKYTHKVECAIPNAYRLRYVEVFPNLKNSTFQHPLMPLLQPYFSTPDVKVRVGHGDVNFYTSDTNIVKELIEKLGTRVRAVHEPEDIEELKKYADVDSKTLVCSSLPYQIYNFKVMLKYSMPVDQREKFHSFIKGYGDKIRCSPMTEAWLQNARYYCYDPYFYVQDQGTLSFMYLFLGDNIRKVYNYKTKASINTVLSQEP